MSANPLSPATQATLLLCSPLRAGRNKDVQPLSIGEFNELEKQLQRAGAGLEQLLEADAAALLKKISPAVDGAKIEAAARTRLHVEHGGGNVAKRGRLGHQPR